MAPQPPRTPLRRLSHGSLRALSRSGTFPDAPQGLGFLEPAMSELADEAEAVHANVTRLQQLSTSLETFNESFASYLYIMEMNSLAVDWPQAPTDASFLLAKEREEEDARKAQAALKAAQEAAQAAEKSIAAAASEQQENGAQIDNASPVNKAQGNTAKTNGSGTKPVVKKKVKPKMTAKERKERNLAIEKAIMNMPLEFRGNDPTLRRHAESVVETLMDNPNGLEILRFVKPPELNQARVNKCLIALINKKIVSKSSDSGRVLYHWNGVPS